MQSRSAARCRRLYMQDHCRNAGDALLLQLSADLTAIVLTGPCWPQLIGSQLMSHASARHFWAISPAAHQSGQCSCQAHDRHGCRGLHLCRQRTSAAILWPQDKTEAEGRSQEIEDQKVSVYPGHAFVWLVKTSKKQPTIQPHIFVKGV